MLVCTPVKNWRIPLEQSFTAYMPQWQPVHLNEGEEEDARVLLSGVIYTVSIFPSASSTQNLKSIMTKICQQSQASTNEHVAREVSQSTSLMFTLRYHYSYKLPSVLWRCRLGIRKSTQSVKTEWWGAGVVICLEVQMICIWFSWCHCYPIISCFVKIQTGLTFLVPAYPCRPGKEAVKRQSVITITTYTKPHLVLTWLELLHWMKSFICRGCSNPVISKGHTSVDIGASANLEVVDKFCYLGDTTAKQVVMVWACVAKRRHWLGEEMYGIWPDQGVDQRGHGERLCKKIAKHIIWTGSMLWIVVDGRSW